MLKLFRMTVIVLLLVTTGCNTQEKDSANGGQPGTSPAAAGQTPQVTPDRNFLKMAGGRTG